jgi:glycosyltransferase involved in cell wall biosynthesis
VSRWDRRRARYVWGIARRGPTEAGYAYFRARRRRRNLADDEVELSVSDRLVAGGDLDLGSEELAAHRRAVTGWEHRGPTEIRSIQWLLPWFHLVYGGGIYTVLRFADHFARQHGVESRFRVYDRGDERSARQVASGIAGAFPALAQAPVTAAGSPLAPSDAAIATAWTSAFPLARHRGAPERFFFVQDFEPAFHPAGSASAVLEQAARLGLPGIVNTPGLADVYRAYGNPAVSFRPAVDGALYRPGDERSGGGPVRIFFYGRPSQPRNAFGLGLAVLREVKRRFGAGVQIVCAGEDWNPGQYGVADVLENHGQLSDLESVARLYGSCHIGLCFMLTPHPSYQPLEFMACGAATVCNRNPHTRWLLRHEENCLLAPALPSAVADQVARLVEDRELRERIAAAGREQAAAVTWEQEIERVWEAMTTRPELFTAERETGRG